MGKKDELFYLRRPIYSLLLHEIRHTICGLFLYKFRRPIHSLFFHKFRSPFYTLLVLKIGRLIHSLFICLGELRSFSMEKVEGSR